MHERDYGNGAVRAPGTRGTLGSGPRSTSIRCRRCGAETLSISGVRLARPGEQGAEKREATCSCGEVVAVLVVPDGP